MFPGKIGLREGLGQVLCKIWCVSGVCRVCVSGVCVGCDTEVTLSTQMAYALDSANNDKNK